MTIAKIRKGNRITIPVEEMKKKSLAEGDEVYFEVSGKIGRDVFITHGYGMTGMMASSTIYVSTATIPVQY